MSAHRSDAVQTLTIEQQYGNQEQPSLLGEKKTTVESILNRKTAANPQKSVVEKKNDRGNNYRRRRVRPRRSDDKLCWYFSLLSLHCPPCRKERGRDRVRERGVSLLSVCTFFCSCIRWIQSRAHELSSLFGSVRSPRPARSLSPRSQLERTRALHVTSRPLQYKQLRGTLGGVCVCVCEEGEWGGVTVRNPSWFRHY